MRPYQQERLENAICYFAKEHKRHVARPLDMTTLWKYLAFFDLELLRDTGNAPLGLKFLALERGPVPRDLYRNVDSLKSQHFRVLAGEGRRRDFVAIGTPDLSYFSEVEQTSMKRLIEIFATRGHRTSTISRASHEELRAWRIARERRPNSEIDPADMFDQDLRTKPDEQLTDAEERFLELEAIERTQR